MRHRLLAAALACVACLPAHAGGPQITDPAGDSRIPDGGMDVVSATFSTIGTTAKVRGRKVYTPSKLVVSIAYAADVDMAPYVTHAVTFQTAGCGEVYLQSYGGGPYGIADCLDDNSFDFSIVKNGSTLTFTMPFSLVGKQYFKLGALLTDLTVYTAVGEPVLGYESNEVVTATGVPVDGAIDVATSPVAFRIG